MRVNLSTNATMYCSVLSFFLNRTMSPPFIVIRGGNNYMYMHCVVSAESKAEWGV